MKRILSVLLILVFMFCLGACGDSSSSEDVDYNDVDYNYENADNYAISESQIESEAASALYSKLKAVYRYKCDIDQTKYKIATIKENTTYYEVKGQYSLYDDYGNYIETNNFTVKVPTYGGSAIVTEY